MFKKGDLIRLTIEGDTKYGRAVDDTKNNRTRVLVDYLDVVTKKQKKIEMTFDNKYLTKGT